MSLTQYPIDLKNEAYAYLDEWLEDACLYADTLTHGADTDEKIMEAQVALSHICSRLYRSQFPLQQLYVRFELSLFDIHATLLCVAGAIRAASVSLAECRAAFWDKAKRYRPLCDDIFIINSLAFITLRPRVLDFLLAKDANAVRPYEAVSEIYVPVAQEEDEEAAEEDDYIEAEDGDYEEYDEYEENPTVNQCVASITRILHHFFEDTRAGCQIIMFQGEMISEKIDCVKYAAEAVQRPVVFIDSQTLTRDKNTYIESLHAIKRECTMLNAVGCLSYESTPAPGADIAIEAALLDLCRALPVMIVFCEKNEMPVIHHSGAKVIPVELIYPDANERKAFWRWCMDEIGAKIDRVLLERCASSFLLTKAQIATSVEEAMIIAQSAQRDITFDDLYKTCQTRFSNKMGNKALLTASPFTWDDLVLGEREKHVLRLAIEQYKQRDKVLNDWGFKDKLPYGRGLSILLYGSPGTGKTMAAQIIANELNMQAYRINIAGLVSKYIGETEKNLDQIFQDAQKLNIILFFDEADALFAKRTEVNNSNDRYANMEAAYLLQKMEEFDGITILSTNLLQNFDLAMIRRLTYCVSFGMPDAAQRLLLWRSQLPEKIETEEIDYPFLADSFEFTGANIKNILLTAAYISASEEAPLSMRHIIQSIQLECQKQQRMVSAGEFGRYAYLL